MHRGYVMRLLALPLTVLVALLFTNTARPQVPQESIDALVAKLGSQRYADAKPPPRRSTNRVKPRFPRFRPRPKAPIQRSATEPFF